jgi:hypothetical protein
MSFHPHAATAWSPETDQILRQQYPLVRNPTKGMTLKALAKRVGATEAQVKYRALKLGLVRNIKRQPRWTEDEIEFIANHCHLSIMRLDVLMRKRGWNRTKSAIAAKRKSLGYRITGSGNAYSATELGGLLGKPSRTVSNWIAKGWLRAEPRTESRDPHHQGVGDRWLITPQAVRDFIYAHRAAVDLALVDKDWFLSLMEDLKPARKVLIQDACGSGETLAAALCA